MYTIEERQKLDNYALIEKGLRSKYSEAILTHLCPLAGCQLDRIALRVCEIERDAIKRCLRDSGFEWLIKQKGTK